MKDYRIANDLPQEMVVGKISAFALPGIPRKESLTLRAIEQIVCAKLGINREALHTKARKRELVFSRQLVFFLAVRSVRRLPIGENTVENMGWYYKRNHATVLHSAKTIKNEVETNRATATTVEWLQKQIDNAFL